jgi:hypothetical protein
LATLATAIETATRGSRKNFLGVRE